MTFPGHFETAPVKGLKGYFLIQSHSPVRIMLVFRSIWGFQSIILCQSEMPYLLAIRIRVSVAETWCWIQPGLSASFSKWRLPPVTSSIWFRFSSLFSIFFFFLYCVMYFCSGLFFILTTVYTRSTGQMSIDIPPLC